MRRWVSAFVAMVLVASVAGAWAEPSPTPSAERGARAPTPPRREPTAAEVQAAVGAVGAWSLEYATLLQQAGEVMDEVDSYTAIIDRFAAREIRERAALEQLEAWRVNTVARGQAVRARAVALRHPPSLSAMGEDGAVLENAFAMSRADLPELIDEIIASMEALAAFGADAIRSPSKISDTLRRAVYSSSMQMIRIDTRRISANAAALSDDHPNKHVMETIVAYYAALGAMPAHELRVLDGEPADPASVGATLRQSARDMRVSLARASRATDQMTREIRNAPAPPDVREMQRTVLQMMESFPATIRVYGQLADTLDAAAARIDVGASVVDVWGEQETAAIPLLDQITQLETERSRLAASLQR